VHNRDLQTWLTEDDYAELEQTWAEQQELHVELKDNAVELRRYDEN
jgi:hypothetical protein